MKLELKHLAPYLPYALKINAYATYLGKENTLLDTYDLRYQNRHLGVPIVDFFDKYGWGDGNIDLETLKFKPILRPLSDLTNEIEHRGERFVPTEWFNTNMKLNRGWWIWETVIKDNERLLRVDYRIVQQLFEWHIDAFGLIDADLAIDINTL